MENLKKEVFNKMLGVFQLLLIVGAKLEHIISELAKDAAESHHGEVTVRLSDELFWFHSPDLVLYLIHFILFQNSFEIAFFLWIWVSEFTSFSYSYSYIFIHQTTISIHFHLLLPTWQTTYGFNSCIMEGLDYIIPRLVIG